jgi:hypothetical protein
MASTSTASANPGVTQGLTVAAAAGLILAALPSGIAAAHTPGNIWEVHPGESVQAAVDKAQSGDTINIAPGEYEEAVCIEGKGLTIRGAGADRTVITWPEWTTVDDLPDVEATACWTAQQEVDGEDVEPTLADNVSGLFFLNPDKPVEVTGLKTRNHPASGILVWGADGFSVHGHKGYAHDRYGILALDSTNISLTRNVEIGLDRSEDPLAPNSGTAGISVGDSEDARAHIAGNYVEGYNLGLFLREARGGHVASNSFTGNCIGMLVFDDVATEVPDASRDVQTGAFQVTGNSSTANIRYCLQGREGDQHVSGVGMQVVNADDVSFYGNKIEDNRPMLPEGVPMLTNPAGGLTMFTLPPFNIQPGQVPAGPVENVRVIDNHFGDNWAILGPDGPVQMDIFVGAPGPNVPFLPPGEGLVFHGNACDASIPPTICGPPYPVTP